MLQQIFLGFTGLCSGFIIAGGLTGLMIGLSIIPRYAGITHTADHMMLYEDITFWGTELGNLFFLFHWDIRFGTPFLILYGLFSGIFLGGDVYKRQVELCTSHISTAKTSGYGCFDTFSSGLHCSLHCRFHSTSERDTVLKLKCDILCY